MFEIVSGLNKIKTLFPLFVRQISQFIIPKNDCVPYTIRTHKFLDEKDCRLRDKGLVLGVYYNEFMEPSQRAILTAAAEKYDKQNNGKLWKLLKLSPIPQLGEARVFFDVDPYYAFVAVAGLGSECLTYNKVERNEESKEAIRVAAGVGAKALQKLHPHHIHVESFGNAEAAAEGAALAVWQFTKFKTMDLGRKLPHPHLSLYDDCDFKCWDIGILKAQSQNLARYLQELPANILYPREFAKLIVDLLCDLDINVEIKTQGWAASHAMGGIESIGKSSVQPPLYVEAEYFGTSECTRPVVLIGKGVTFNSGGIDLKPPHVLRYMKGDMAGAACVVAIMRAAALLKLPVNIRGILPLCEMMPGGKGPKFGDIVGTANGKTVQIRVPKHEARLLIADSLVYARNYWPQFTLDIGTMSPELLDTLGNAACACYTNSEEMFNYVETASAQTGDRIWRMPLWKFYEERVQSETADVANAGRQRYGDSPNCAAFLRQFVCDGKWVHLDTYNVTYTKGIEYPYLGRGMTGRPTRTVIELLYQMLADGKLC